MLSSVNSFTFSDHAGINDTEQAIIAAGSNKRAVANVDGQEKSENDGGTAIVPTYKLFQVHRTVTDVWNEWHRIHKFRPDTNPA